MDGTDDDWCMDENATEGCAVGEVDDMVEMDDGDVVTWVKNGRDEIRAEGFMFDFSVYFFVFRTERINRWR